MKVTYNWLREFVDIKIAPKALADKLTMAGLEVASIEQRSGDHIFEIEITSNRPDWLSIIGVAREVAAVTNKKLYAGRCQPRRGKKPHQPNPQRLDVKIGNKKDSPLYTAAVISGVKAGPSPEWLKNRLELMGCRSVNNIVDITNYVLFEIGEPLHAFDLDKLEGDTIFVRRARAGEKITTIDAQERALGTDILVIADSKKPVAVAGVMGGKDTEVTEGTRNILLEAAVFDPVVVRKGRRSLGVQSESSYRFERGVNPEDVETASLRAAEMIRQLCGGVCVLRKRAGAPLRNKKQISLELSGVNNALGIDIPAARVKRILSSLGFKINARSSGRFTVVIPHHRPDIRLQADLIEEIARVYGYENIPVSLAPARPAAEGAGFKEKVAFIKDILVGLGLNEVITYSLIDKKLLRYFGIQDTLEAIEVLNPLSSEQEILRPRLMPSLALCVARNLNRAREYINIFEVSKAFFRSEGSFKEETRLAVGLCGERSFLLESGLIKDPASPLHLKGILEVVFERMGIKEYAFCAQEGSSDISVSIRGETVGFITKAEKSALDNLDIKNKDLFALEVSLEKMISYADPERRYKRLPVYPGICRDISFILKKDIPAGGLLKAVEERGRPLLKEVKVSDCYQGKQIPQGFKGLTVSCFYRSDERTLTESEVSPVHSLICSLLKDEFGAQFR
ncbi:MAG: phenylalanine--tRNA ligase subunit beta [Candidatus Omnitrophota bacterium]|jgi:phenylalanyl-tRNA synthetase beta chain